MTVKQISLITMKSGQKANLPDSLDEAEICFTTDTGEIFIGAPNFPAVQYRSDQSASTNGQGISPFRNIKVLTEFDVTKTITGDFYTQEALDRTVVPLTSSPYKIYTFEPGVNSIIASYSLYDGQNVNLVGELFMSVFEGDAMICNAGQQVDGIQFTSKLNSSNEIELYSVNETDSIYTMYISAKCWKSNVAEWDGTKGNGIKPFCLNMKDEDDGLPSIAICTDVKLSDLSNNQFLKYNSTDNKWENTTINYSDITGTPPVAPPSIATCTDVTLSNLANKNFLQFNSTDNKWENVSISYSDITGTIPASGEEYLKNLKDVKLSVLSDNQYLKFNLTDGLWENATINYSDITGTPPSTPVAIADCSDVKLTNLADNQILQYSAADKMWENTPVPPTVSKWIVGTGISAAGTSSADATIIDSSSNVIPVTSASVVQQNTITAGTIAPTSISGCVFLENIGVGYTGLYNTNIMTSDYDVTISLPGGTGTGAKMSLPVYVTPMPYQCVFTGDTSWLTTSGNYYLGGRMVKNSVDSHYEIGQTGTTYHVNDDHVYSGVLINPTTDITIVSSNSTSATFILNRLPTIKEIGATVASSASSTDNNIIPVPVNTTLNVYSFVSSEVQFGTNGTSWPSNTATQIGTIEYTTLAFYNCFGGNTTSGAYAYTLDGGTGYTVGDQLSMILNGAPKNYSGTNIPPIFTVTAVTTTPPKGIKLSSRNVGEMILVHNHTGSEFIVYPEDGGTINGESTGFVISNSNLQTELIRTTASTWYGFST